MMGSLFTLFVVEMWLNAKTGGHSHGGPTGVSIDHGHAHGHAHGISRGHGQHRGTADPPKKTLPTSEYLVEKFDKEDMRAVQSIYEKHGPPSFESDMYKRDSQSSMPVWFMVFYEQYVRQHTQLIDMMSDKGATAIPSEKRVTVVEYHEDEENQPVDPDVYRKMSTNITLLEGGILFHSVFVGMTVSITVDGFVILLVAILFHQMFDGLGLGSRIAAVPYPKSSIRPWVLVLAFGTTAPIGQAIGLISRNSYDPKSAFGLIIVGIFNAM